MRTFPERLRGLVLLAALVLVDAMPAAVLTPPGETLQTTTGASSCDAWCNTGDPVLACAEERCAGCDACLATGSCAQWCGVAAPEPPMQCGLLWYTHISKTGG